MATIRVEKGREDSFELLAQVGLEGTRKGATHILLIGEGAQSFMDVTGWGVALGYTHAYINTEAASQSGVGTAGVGFTKGTAERKGNPFLQVLFLKALPMPVAVEQKKVEEVKAPAPTPAPVSNVCGNPPQISVKFAIGKDLVEASQNSVIKEMAGWLKSTKCLSILKGGASKEKDQTYNAGLGLRRAENVRNALMKEGIEKGQIVLAVSSGKDFPVSTDEKENREVDIITISGLGNKPIAK
jgi:outer membrane protein OmpA-like peptidoglycan-associated protein